MSLPVSAAPHTMLTTPFGKPLCLNKFAMNSAPKGVYSAGFRITTFPHAFPLIYNNNYIPTNLSY